MADNEATGGSRPLRFGVVAPLRTDLPAWRDQVRRIADSGYSTLLMPDVQQWQPAPGPTLAVAATVADLRVGTWVYASPLRTPWSMAWEAHSLSVLTEGRFEMGIGTGRPGIEDELRQLGLPVVTPSERLSMVGGWRRFSEAPRRNRWRRKAGSVQVLAERSEQIRERNGHLGAVPRAQDPTERAALLDVRGRPEQDQAETKPANGAVRATAWGVWFWAWPKPRCCLLSWKVTTSRVQRAA